EGAAHGAPEARRFRGRSGGFSASISEARRVRSPVPVPNGASSRGGESAFAPARAAPAIPRLGRSASMPRRPNALRFAVACVLLAAGRSSFGQAPESGPRVMTFFSDVDDSEQPYGLYLPKGFDPAKKYPLVVMLHGGGSNHRLALRRVFGKSNKPGETDVEATRYFPE